MCQWPNFDEAAITSILKKHCMSLKNIIQRYSDSQLSPVQCLHPAVSKHTTLLIQINVLRAKQRMGGTLHAMQYTVNA